MKASRILASLSLAVFAVTLLGGCGDPCKEWEEYERKAYQEGAYFKYEDRIESAKRQCMAEYGVSP